MNPPEIIANMRVMTAKKALTTSHPTTPAAREMLKLVIKSKPGKKPKISATEALRQLRYGA
jgi:hypothetical protein